MAKPPRAEQEQVARAIAFFDACDDIPLLYEATRNIATRVKALVRDLMRKGDEDSIPAPVEVSAMEPAATRAGAMAAVQQTGDFGLLQALARSIGRRIEQLEIVASASLVPGARVLVPAERGYPRRGAELEGEVESTGLATTVRLADGTEWNGPPSLARLAETGETNS